MKPFLLLALLASCSSAAPEHDATREPLDASPVILADPDAGTEHVGEHTPWELPTCVGLLPSYRVRFGMYGYLVAAKVVDDWLIATDHPAGSVPVTWDASCPITVASGHVEEVDGKHRVGVAKRGRITLSDRAGLGEPCDYDDNGEPLNNRFLLSTILAHELGHTFDCRHQSAGLMRDGAKQCEYLEVDEMAAGCARLLRDE